MSEYHIRITKTAKKDINKLSPKMKNKLKAILVNILIDSPYEDKRLIGDLEGNYSIRLNITDRIVYSIDEQNKTVYIKRAKTHYGD
jgi:mRNA-degrading endonuclease RelE of RelBE toxin-antitoxin system